MVAHRFLFSSFMYSFPLATTTQLFSLWQEVIGRWLETNISLILKIVILSVHGASQAQALKIGGHFFQRSAFVSRTICLCAAYDSIPATVAVAASTIDRALSLTHRLQE